MYDIKAIVANSDLNIAETYDINIFVTMNCILLQTFGLYYM